MTENSFLMNIRMMKKHFTMLVNPQKKSASKHRWKAFRFSYERPRHELNAHLVGRSHPVYPLAYGDIMKMGMTGFEPAWNGLKVRCIASMLHVHMKVQSINDHPNGIWTHISTLRMWLPEPLVRWGVIKQLRRGSNPLFSLERAASFSV